MDVHLVIMMDECPSRSCTTLAVAETGVCKPQGESARSWCGPENKRLDGPADCL
jgi:hypothetical protein